MTSKEGRKGEREVDREGMDGEEKGEKGGGTTKNSSIYRHPISFPITRTSETGDLFGLFSYETFFGTISKEKSSLHPRSSFPSSPVPSISLHPGSPRFLHTRLRSILTETNIRIFVIPFAGYIERVFLSRKRTRRSSSLSSSPSLLPFDNWKERRNGKPRRCTTNSCLFPRFNSRQTRAVIRKLDSKRERLFWQLESRKFERRE